MKIIKNEPLAKHTTFKIGGPAKYFCQINTAKQLKEAYLFAKKNKLAYILIGNGSNILISDRGYRGLVIKNKIDYFKFGPKGKNRALFIAGSGMTLTKLAQLTVSKSYFGLHNFAYIPGTVGGAVYINAHYKDKFIGDFVQKGEVLDSTGNISVWSKNDFDFAYDSSKLKKQGGLLISAIFSLLKGNKAELEKEMDEILVNRKEHPACSAGCIWQNLSQKEQTQLKLRSQGVAYLIDKVLKLKGKKEGQAQISQNHAAFIENLGQAKADDVLKLIKLVKSEAKAKYNIDLRLEIDLIGFAKDEIKMI